MSCFEIENKKEGLLVRGLRDFSLPQTLDCGQCFRWQSVNEEQTLWNGIALGRLLTIEKQEEDVFFFYPCTEEEFYRLWVPYFDLERDYGEIKTQLSKDPIMEEAIAYAPGIRVLRQDGWETLCTFIISQNNNIKRIRGIVERFCTLLGKPIDGGYDFPTPEQVATATLEDLAPLRAGFRAKYLLDAAQKVQSGQLQLEHLSSLPYAEAQAELRQIYGVGPKVADCTLLFGFGRMDAFPMDVWMKRVMQLLYPLGLPDEVLPYRGIAQQYLFHYARMHQIQ